MKLLNVGVELIYGVGLGFEYIPDVDDDYNYCVVELLVFRLLFVLDK